MGPTTAMIIAQGVHGIAYGMILFLIASGLTMIFGMMGILNLAHAAFFMVAAYFGYEMVRIMGSFWLALAVGPVAVACLGIVTERFLIRKAHARGHSAELILTVGVSLFITAIVKSVWGTETLILKVPPSLQGLITVAGLEYPVYRLFVIGLTLVVLLLMAFLLYKTRLGKIVRAAVSDADMVSALGINMPLVFMFVFGFGTWLAGVAGVVVAPIISVFPGLGDQIGMDAFMVIITGGFGSLLGAFIVSMLFGLISSYGVQFLSQLAPLLMLLFMAIVLAVRPMGLLGDKE